MTLRPLAVRLSVAVAAIGIVSTWIGLSSLTWQLPAFAIIVLIYVEFNDVRSSAFTIALSQPPLLGLGAEHEMSVAVTNNGSRKRHVRACPVPPSGVIGAQLEELRMLLAKGESRSLDFVASGGALGQHTWPPQPLEIRGRLGLADWITHLPVTITSRVVPNRKFVQLTPQGLSQSGQRQILKAGAGGEEFRGIRSYSPGDPPGAIDWKATARHCDLMVRETTNTEHIEIIVAIDAGLASGLACGELSVLGNMVNVAARLMSYAHLRGDRAGLLVFADRVLGSLPSGHGLAHQQRLQDLLAATVTTSAESNPLPAIVALSKLAQRRSLIVLFCQLHDTQASGQLMRAIKLLRPKHMPLIVALRDPAIDALAVQDASHWLDPYMSLAAIEYRREVRSIKQRLQRLGADVVESTPDMLGAAVLDRYQQLMRLRKI